ncbi:hypothetical protein OUZ56_008617 [Daphnia magna]|uniref:Uncharacterized protein n=1 Tax=Daphnia magna TaxID=35525 RepID=A0ABR0ADI2_9CRUS|nr:hypothetical protein OUZ56_008617 [Daphnia magna]
MAIQQRKAGLASNAYCRLNNNPPTCMTHVLISVSKLRQVTRALGFKKDVLRLVVPFIVSEKAQKETSLSFNNISVLCDLNTLRWTLGRAQWLQLSNGKMIIRDGNQAFGDSRVIGVWSDLSRSLQLIRADKDFLTSGEET